MFNLTVETFNPGVANQLRSLGFDNVEDSRIKTVPLSGADNTDGLTPYVFLGNAINTILRAVRSKPGETFTVFGVEGLHFPYDDEGQL
jgi:hypothetical protein